MAVTLYSTATEYIASALTFARGDETDVDSVWVYAGGPNDVPAENEFTEATLVFGADPLAEGENIDVLALVGPTAEGVDLTLEPGTYQWFVGVKTATEFMIRKIDDVTVL